jgi:hypothetical protein
MKKLMMILLIAIGVSSIAFGQTKMSKDAGNSVEAQIIALEKAGWEAWKNKDSAWYQTNLAKDALHVPRHKRFNQSATYQQPCRLRSQKHFAQ